MQSLSPFLFAVLMIVFGVDAAAATPIFRWQGPNGGWHFSNRSEGVPPAAIEVDATPLPVVTRVRGFERRAPGSEPRASARRLDARCSASDPSALAAAVTSRLNAGQGFDDLTLLVAGTPVAHGRGAVVTVKGADDTHAPTAPLEQGAIAYAGENACPTGPPLARYAVSSGHRNGRRSLCDDFQRAFAEVGVAVSRDQGVARSFRSIAQGFVSRAAAGDPGSKGIPPWMVQAHIAQTDELGEEAAEVVDELTLALEEIDIAARARGCW